MIGNNNSRKTWRLLNDVVNNGRSKKKKGISDVEVENLMIENSDEVSDNLISHLYSVDAEFDSKIQHYIRSPLSYMGQSCIKSFYAGRSSDSDVKLFIWALNC